MKLAPISSTMTPVIAQRDLVLVRKGRRRQVCIQQLESRTMGGLEWFGWRWHGVPSIRFAALPFTKRSRKKLDLLAQPQRESVGVIPATDEPSTRSRMILTRIVLAFGALVMIASSQIVIAQSASIAGVVSHGAGQPLSGVTVTVTPESGGPSRHTSTGKDGTYRFAGLPDSTYRVDFELPVFAVVRRNHVTVRSGIETNVDADLPVRAICECITVEPPSPWAQRTGQVIDKAGHPLPHARVELVGRQAVYTDGEGRFLVRVPVNEAWPLTATDTGFRRVTQNVSGADAATVVLSLEYVGATGVPDVERFGGCECDGYLLRYGVR